MFASAGNVLKLHTLADPQLRPISVYKPKKLLGAASPITAVSWCHDNGYIAVLQEDNHPQILSSKDRTNVNLVHTIQAVKHASALSFKRNTKRTLALGSCEGDVVLYDTKTRSVARKLTRLESPVKLLEFNTTDERLAIATERSLSFFSDSDRMNSFVRVAEYLEPCTSVTFHPSCQHLIATGTSTGAVQLRDLEQQRILSSWHKHSASITGVSFAGQQRLLVTTGLDRKVCVSDQSTSESVFKMNLPQPVTCSALSFDEVHLAAGLEDGHVYVYDLREPLRPLASEKAHSCAVNRIVFERSSSFALPETTSSATTLNESCSEMRDATGEVDSFEEKLKRELGKSLKTHMGYLEGQLSEHCGKFQAFVNSEFEAIHAAMARWEVFNVAETCEGGQGVDLGEGKSARSVANK